MHGLWGPHLFLALTAMVIALLLLAGKTPPKWHKKGATINLVILFLAVAVASTLKYVHDRTVHERSIQLPAGMPSSR
jgi:integral membrane sensor domain MASE1